MDKGLQWEGEVDAGKTASPLVLWEHAAGVHDYAHAGRYIYLLNYRPVHKRNMPPAGADWGGEAAGPPPPPLLPPPAADTAITCTTAPPEMCTAAVVAAAVRATVSGVPSPLVMGRRRWRGRRRGLPFLWCSPGGKRAQLRR